MATKKKTYTMGQLQTDVEWLKTQMSNHLAHHWAVELALVTAIIGLLVFIIKGHINF